MLYQRCLLQHYFPNNWGKSKFSVSNDSFELIQPKVQFSVLLSYIFILIIYIIKSIRIPHINDAWSKYIFKKIYILKLLYTL